MTSRVQQPRYCDAADGQHILVCGVKLKARDKTFTLVRSTADPCSHDAYANESEAFRAALVDDVDRRSSVYGGGKRAAEPETEGASSSGGDQVTERAG